MGLSAEISWLALTVIHPELSEGTLCCSASRSKISRIISGGRPSSMLRPCQFPQGCQMLLPAPNIHAEILASIFFCVCYLLIHVVFYTYCKKKKFTHHLGYSTEKHTHFHNPFKTQVSLICYVYPLKYSSFKHIMWTDNCNFSQY